MSSSMTDFQPSAAVRREAAVWIARIHSPERTPHVEAGLRQWLAEAQENRTAFEMANELWEVAGRVPEEAVPRVMRWKGLFNKPVRPLRTLASVCALLIAVVAGIAWWPHRPVISTGIGEQRSITLKDGTRIALNTATRLEVHYDDAGRDVELISGEALFDVARDAKRPFIVRAGARQVRVLGTSFIVRHEPTRTAVTLVEGKISVRDTGATGRSTTENPSSDRRPLMLAPGQRLVFVPRERPVLDRPAMEKVTAWQRGLVALDHTPLGDAVAEMNRYSVLQLELASREAAAAPISGVFRAGDSVFFAQAIARTYGLEVVQRDGRIMLAGVPRRTF